MLKFGLLSIFEVRVPQNVNIYKVDQVNMTCIYKIFKEDEPPTVTWLKGDLEIASCALKDILGRQNVVDTRWVEAGVRGVDEARRSLCSRGEFTLQLRGLRLAAQDDYTCALKRGGLLPDIRTSARLSVLVPPEDIEILGALPDYSGGSNVLVSCKVSRTYPHVLPHWYIGEKEIPMNMLEYQLLDEPDSRGVSPVVATLRGRAGAAPLDAPGPLRCVATSRIDTPPDSRKSAHSGVSNSTAGGAVASFSYQVFAPDLTESNADDLIPHQRCVGFFLICSYLAA